MNVIALKNNDIVIGYYAGDDVDVASKAEAMRFDTQEEADSTAGHANETWELAEGERFSVESI